MRLLRLRNGILGSAGLAVCGIGAAHALTAAPPTGLTVTGQVVDKTNGKGWYNHAVTVHWTCSDDPGAVVACPPDSLVTTEGASQSISSPVATDDRGNTAIGVVNSISIDETAPETKVTFGGPKYVSVTTGAWYDRHGATVTAVSDDGLVNPLSGVAASYVNVDLGSGKAVSGLTDIVGALTPSGSTAGTGFHTERVWSEDNAGNAEAMDSGNKRRQALVHIDDDVPAITATRSALPNANGWYNAPVSVTYSCSDASSGVATCPGAHTETTEGVKDVAAMSDDNVGNTGIEVEHLNIDETPPTVTTGPTEAPNANGWYNHPVTVHTTCTDNLSGDDSCDTDEVVSGEGAHSGSHQGSDKAGNSGSGSFNLKIDTVAPGVTVSGPADGSTIVLGSPVATPSCTATDAVSGLGTSTCTGTLTGGNAKGVGLFTYTARATDLAGNTTTKVIHYRVVYNFTGFNSPGNNSQTNAGNVVSVTFTLKNAAGQAVQAGAAPVWLAPQKGGLLKVGAGTFGPMTPTASLISFDPKRQQYSFSWQTSKAQAGTFWQIGIRLDDGTDHVITVGLR
ncbi:MAG TPA: PxKF domain-containing protein [Acidimicrobiales bacterium]|nr:PxKF domain-containing protein [Acidimicrobiales bacterium]